MVALTSGVPTSLGVHDLPPPQTWVELITRSRALRSQHERQLHECTERRLAISEHLFLYRQLRRDLRSASEAVCRSRAKLAKVRRALFAKLLVD